MAFEFPIPDLWVVRAWTPDRHAALLASAPERKAYFYDEKSGWFLGMRANGMQDSTGVMHVLRADKRAGRGIACGKTG